jgi:hypothetical protein
MYWEATDTPDELRVGGGVGFGHRFAVLANAIGGGFLGLILGSICGGVLGRWMAAKSADGRKAIEDGRKGALQDNRAEPDAPVDQPRNTRFFKP